MALISVKVIFIYELNLDSLGLRRLCSEIFVLLCFLRQGFPVALEPVLEQLPL